MASREEKKKQMNRFTRLMIGLIGFIIILIACGYGVNAYTSTPSFCKSCHEMQPEYATHSISVHKNISCVKCHDKPGIQNLIPNKVKLLKEAYIHFTGQVPKQITVKKLNDVPTENCLQCHTKSKLVKATGDLKVNHPGHIIKDGIPCITCHAGISHGKIAARGLNTASNRDNFTAANTKKIMAKQDVMPNMGTCIDCHDKVNKGQKPWKDTNYVMPPINQKTDTAEQDKKTQDLILQAIGKHKTKNAKISMDCKTCHKIVNIPAVHKNPDWQVNHGSMALQELNKCLTCHQDSKWVKPVPKDNMISVLKSANQQVEKAPNNAQTVESIRANKFCNACHSKEPPSHTQSGDWAFDHAASASTANSRTNCSVCHDEKTQTAATNVPKAPAVSCESCHQYFSN